MSIKIKIDYETEQRYGGEWFNSIEDAQAYLDRLADYVEEDETELEDEEDDEELTWSSESRRENNIKSTTLSWSTGEKLKEISTSDKNTTPELEEDLKSSGYVVTYTGKYGKTWTLQELQK